MRRISIHIRSKRNPEVDVPGYLVMHELGNEMLTFFSTKKFNHEEELEITAEIHGALKKYEVQLSQCNEQISSGRVMTAVPVEGAPLPTRTFYRCFTKIKSLAAMEDKPGVGDDVQMTEVKVPVMPDAVPAAADAAPAVEPVVAEQKAA